MHVAAGFDERVRERPARGQMQIGEQQLARRNKGYSAGNGSFDLHDQVGLGENLRMRVKHLCPAAWYSASG